MTAKFIYTATKTAIGIIQIDRFEITEKVKGGYMALAENCLCKIFNISDGIAFSKEGAISLLSNSYTDAIDQFMCEYAPIKENYI